jgi:hypothetical protein
LTADARLPAAVSQRLGKEIILGQVAAERPDAAHLVDQLLAHQGGHAGVADDGKELGSQVDARLHSAEKYLKLYICISKILKKYLKVLLFSFLLQAKISLIVTQKYFRQHFPN